MVTSWLCHGYVMFTIPTFAVSNSKVFAKIGVFDVTTRSIERNSVIVEASIKRGCNTYRAPLVVLNYLACLRIIYMGKKFCLMYM